jgi:hypothetical protein
VRPCHHRPEGGPDCTSGDACPWALAYWKRRAESAEADLARLKEPRVLGGVDDALDMCLYCYRAHPQGVCP